MTSGIVGREAQLLEVEGFLEAAAAGFAAVFVEAARIPCDRLLEAACLPWPMEPDRRQ